MRAFSNSLLLFPIDESGVTLTCHRHLVATALTVFFKVHMILSFTRGRREKLFFSLSLTSLRFPYALPFSAGIENKKQTSNHLQICGCRNIFACAFFLLFFFCANDFESNDGITHLHLFRQVRRKKEREKRMPLERRKMKRKKQEQ